MTVITFDPEEAVKARRRRENPWAEAGLYRFDDLPERPALESRGSYPAG